MIRICETFIMYKIFPRIYTDVLNVHMHRNPKNTRNTDDSLGSGTKLLITFLTFRFSTRGERHTIFTMLTVPSDQTTRVYPAANNWTRLGPNLNSLFVFSKYPSPLLPGMTSFTSPVPFPIRWFYYDICDCYILPAGA